MSLLKTLVTEIAAAGSVGAGAIAATHGSLFGNNQTKPKTKKRKQIMLRRIAPMNVFPRLAESIGLSTAKTKFNAADVISKLDAAEKQADADHDTVTFGMEDDNGNLVKVHVRADQAEEFERTLSAMLSGSDENSDDQNSSIEIAEVLFNLKNKFDIIDVDWGTIQTDEEEEQEIDPDVDDLDVEDDMDDEDELGDESFDDAGIDDSANAKSALDSVIELLKQQAEAQAAEAQARAAEARAKEAEYAARAAEARVKQEEEILDMETYYKEQADQKKEAQRLAKLAKFRHETAKEAEQMMRDGRTKTKFASVTVFDSEENEERRVVSPRELAAAIYRQLEGR